MSNSSNGLLVPDPGSFRDPTGQIYSLGKRILRGVDEATAAHMHRLLTDGYFSELVRDGDVVETHLSQEEEVDHGPACGGRRWPAYLEHERVPFITYPYEWTGTMLRDAALLQLRLTERSLENGWTLKDASAFNVQWRAHRPVFIDVASFEPWTKGEPWLAYRQFCEMFLIPLMLRNYLGIDHTGLLRANLDGIRTIEASRWLRGTSRFRRGVLSHVVMPAIVERSIARRERDAAPTKKRTAFKQTDAMVIGLVQSLRRLVTSFKPKIDHTNWSRYDQTHTYDDDEFAKKKDFVSRHVVDRRWPLAWDLGCNTGTFSRIIAPRTELTIAMDADHDTVEQLYLAQRDASDGNILPLVINLANPSPGQGWRGRERKSLEQRGTPDLVLCLALVHHIRISANIPLPMFLDWIKDLACDLIIEFVDRHDEMVVKLLTNKKEQYADYSRESFESELAKRFRMDDHLELKGGRRIIYKVAPIR